MGPYLLTPKKNFWIRRRASDHSKWATKKLKRKMKTKRRLIKKHVTTAQFFIENKW